MAIPYNPGYMMAHPSAPGHPMANPSAPGHPGIDCDPCCEGTGGGGDPGAEDCCDRLPNTLHVSFGNFSGCVSDPCSFIDTTVERSAGNDHVWTGTATTTSGHTFSIEFRCSECACATCNDCDETPPGTEECVDSGIAALDPDRLVFLIANENGCFFGLTVCLKNACDPLEVEIIYEQNLETCPCCPATFDGGISVLPSMTVTITE